MKQQRVKAHAAYAAIQDDATRRTMVLTDLFYLMVHILGRTDMDNDWCFARCQEVQKNPDGYLDLWAREHYKSTIITVGKTIQDILANPEITVGIFSHTRPIAKSFLLQIKRTFEDCDVLKALFPDILWQNPRRQAPKWAEDGGLIVQRSSNPKESTVEAWGLIDGQPTSKHFSLLVYDDVVTRESVTTPEMISKVTDAWALSLNLGAHGGAMRLIGTRYHVHDTYAKIMERKAAIPRVYAATCDGTPMGEPVLMPKEALEKKYQAMGPYVFGCQMLQNPVADRSQGFSEHWLRFWQGALPPCNFYLLADPASSKKEQGDYTSMWVVGLGADRNIYIVDGLRDRLNLTERTAQLFRLHRLYRPLRTGYERYGMQADVEHIKHMQGVEGYRFDIIELGGQMSKHDRIRRLVPAFEQHRVYLRYHLRRISNEGKHYDLVRSFVDEEFLCFPVCRHDDMLDCLARVYDLGVQFPQPERAQQSPRRMAQTYYDAAAYGMQA